VQYETEHGFYIDTVAASPAHQGSGIGRALLVFAEGEACRRGFSINILVHQRKDDREPDLLPKDRLR